MTTTQSQTTAARQTHNATEKTAETFKRGAREVTGKADQVFGQQLPTVDLTQGVERYFEFVQKAVDVNRELATNWADAVNSFSGVVRDQTDKAGQLVTEQTEKARELTTEQTEKVRELTTEQADKVGSAARDQVDKVGSAARDQVDKVEQAEKTQARRVRQATNGHTNGHTDGQNERLIDTK